MPHAQSFIDLVEEAKPRVAEMNTATLYAHMENNEPMTIIDVREDREWDQGHIPGAIHIGKGVIECHIAQHIPDLNTPIILYCGGGYRSILAADSLLKMGYTNVTSLAGGWRDWHAHYAVTTPE